PSTKITGSSLAASALRTARVRTVSPSRSRSSLFSPIRVEGPAARTIPATLPERRALGGGPCGLPFSLGHMDRAFSLPQPPPFARGMERQDLRDNRAGHLLPPLRPQVEPDGTVHAAILLESDLAQDLAGPGARTEHPHVRDCRREEHAGPLPVVRERVRLDDRVGARLQRNLSASVAGPFDHEPGGAWE